MPKTSLFTFWPPDASFANWFSGLKEWNVLTLQGMECTYKWFFPMQVHSASSDPGKMHSLTKKYILESTKMNTVITQFKQFRNILPLLMIHLLYFFFWVSNEKCSLIGSFLGFHVTSFDHRVYEKACGPRRHKSLLSLPISHRSLCSTRSLWHRVDRKQKTRNK